MMNETLSFGLSECPIIRPEGIYYGGVKVISLGLRGVGVGDVGDLLAYRQMWEPFIAAHLALWRDVNDRFENSPDVSKCPAGIFTNSQIQNLAEPWKSWCASLAYSRMMVSTTNPDGILPRWNAWAGKTSAEIVAGAPQMLGWLQSVVMQVGGADKNRLALIGQTWDIDIKLPDVPTFDAQQDVISRIQGAYVATKGVLQILGYGTGATITQAADAAQAVAQGLTDGAKALPKALNWALIAGAVAVAVVAGGLIIYYVPRQPRQSAPILGRI